MGKRLTDYANLFSPNNYKKNDDIILNYWLRAILLNPLNIILLIHQI